MNPPGPKAFDVRLKFLDLSSQPPAMHLVLCRIHRLAFERRVFGAQGIDLATKPIVFGFDVFVFAHGEIVARWSKMGAPCRTL